MNNSIKTINTILILDKKFRTLSFCLWLILLVINVCVFVPLYLSDSKYLPVLIFSIFAFPIFITVLINWFIRNAFFYRKYKNEWAEILEISEVYFTKREYVDVFEFRYSFSIIPFTSHSNIFSASTSTLLLFDLLIRVKDNEYRSAEISNYLFLQIRRKNLRSGFSLLFIILFMTLFLLFEILLGQEYLWFLFTLTLVPIVIFFIEKRLVSKFDFEKLEAELKSKNLDKIKLKKFLTLPYLKMDGHLLDKKTFKYLYGISDKNNDSL